MTQYGLPFDGVTLGDAAVAPYSAAEWARMEAMAHGHGPSFGNYGVFKGSGDGTHEALQVLQTSPSPTTSITVYSGAALVNGRFYETTVSVDLAIAGNASGNPRIDTVVLRVDYALQTVRLAVKQGTPAASPARVAMQQDTSFWEMPLADIAVANGVSIINSVFISQRQRYVFNASGGWMPYAYPDSYLVNGNYNSTSLPPTTTVDGMSLAFPFKLSGNLLIDKVAFWQVSASVLSLGWGWDIYFQDTNDGNASEKTLRRVAYCNENSAQVLPGAASIVSMAPARGPIALPPGAYWLVIQRRGGTIPWAMGGIAPTSQIPMNTYKYKVTTNPNGQTLDMVTGWTLGATIPGAALYGRVFGEITPF